MDLPPEILSLAKASPWAFVAYFTIRQIGALLAPIAYVFSLRLARSEKERAALVELFRIARGPVIRLPWQKGDQRTGNE